VERGEEEGEEMKKAPPSVQHEQAKRILASEALVVAKYTGLSVDFCARIAMNRMIRRAQAVRTDANARQ